MNDKFLKILSAFLMALLFSLPAVGRGPLPQDTVALSDLPVQARQTLDAIDRGGPFAYPKDGVVFGNYEKILPLRQRGYYHEYTVKTPYARGRGARRLITGGEPPQEIFYTDDHYASFKRVTR